MPVATRRTLKHVKEELGPQQSEKDDDDEDEPFATQMPETEVLAPLMNSQEEDDSEEVALIEKPEHLAQSAQRSDKKVATPASTVNDVQPPAGTRPALVQAQFAMPPSAEALVNVQDLAEYWIDRIMLEPEQSKKHYVNLKYFYGLNFNGADINFGRLHCRTIMAELLVKIYSEPLLSWDRDMWNDAIYDEIVSLTRKLMRKDASVVIEYGRDVDNVEDATHNPANPLEKIKPRVRTLLSLIKLHMALAPIRAKLEAAIDKRKQPKINSGVLRDVLEYLQKVKFKDSYCIEQLHLMINPTRKELDSGDSDSDETSEDTYLLSDIVVIGKILREDRVFSLELLKEKILRTVRRLDRAVYGAQPSLLVSKNYRYIPPANVQDKKRRQDEAQLAELSNERKKLKENGQDPLAMALEHSLVACNGSKPTEDECTSQQLSMATPDKDDEEESGTESDHIEKRVAHQLSLPSPQALKIREMIRKQTREADEGIFDENGLVKSRRPWNENEDAALKEGVIRFGIGRWKQIKEYFPDVLHNRQTVQIKDRYRTLLNQGRL